MVNIMTQQEAILWHFKQNDGLTSKQAYDDLGITQLGARLDELEAQGHRFDRKDWIEVADRRGNRVKVKNYHLITEKQTEMSFE